MGLTAPRKPIKFPAHAPSGVYRTRKIIVRDLANTYADANWEIEADLVLQKRDFSREEDHAFEVTIDNENPGDVDPPEVRQLLVENKAVRVGESLFLTIQYADLSGLVGGKASVHFYEPYKKGEEKGTFKVETDIKARWLISDSLVRLEIPVSVFQRKGHYRLGTLRLWDRSGNEITLYGNTEEQAFETLKTFRYVESEKKSYHDPYWHTVNVPEVEIVP